MKLIPQFRVITWFFYNKQFQVNLKVPFKIKTLAICEDILLFPLDSISPVRGLRADNIMWL